MKEKFKYLIPVIIITTLVFPEPVFAMIGTGIFDYFETALGGVEELSGPVAAFILMIFLYYVVGLGSLFISSSLLQLVLKNLSFLSVINNPMVLSGWSFIAGITNMFFILIFVFIALATILKIETLAAKKLLPKLLIVALLVNFSLIFVGVMIDVSNIFYATIIGGDTDLIPDIFSVLTGSGEDIMVTIIALVSVLLIAFIVPFVGPFAQFGLVVLIVATGFIGQLLIWLIQGMMFFMMSGILLTFVFLFTARIFVLQLLAMVAPIAFLCSVLPQTKKYWDDWLKMVVEWNTFGIVTLLFLVVGLRGASALLPAGGSAGLSFSGSTLFWGDLPGYLTYYFFLFVYLVSLLYFSQKYSPQMAQMLIGQAKSMGGMIYAKGLKPLGKAATQDARKTWDDWLAKQATADADKKPSRLQRWTKSKTKVLGPMLRRIGRGGIKAGVGAQKRIAKKWEGYSAEQIQAIVGAEGEGLKKRKDFSKYERMVIASRLAEKGGMKKFTKLDSEIQKEIASYAAEKDPKALETILTKGNPNLANKDSALYKKDPEAFHDSKIAETLKKKIDTEEDSDYKEIYEETKEKHPELTSPEEIKKEAIAQTIFQRTIDSIKSSDIKDINKKMFMGPENKKLRQVMVKRFGPEYWNQIAKHFDQKVMDAFSDTRDNMGAEYLAKVNPRTLNYWATYGSDRWGWRKMKGVETKKDVEKLLRGARVEKRGSGGVVEEITRKQEELNGLLGLHIKITEQELDKKVGTAKKAEELSEKFPERTEDENWFEAKRFLSKEFEKAEKDLKKEKMKDSTRFREIKRGMKQKNREKAETLQKEIKQSKEEFRNAYMEERIMREKRLKELGISEKVDDRFKKIRKEASTIETKKETYKVMDFLGIKKEDQDKRFRNISLDLLKAKAEKQLIKEKETILKKVVPKEELKGEISRLKEELKEKPVPSPEERRERIEKEAKKGLKEDIKRELRKRKEIKKIKKEEKEIRSVMKEKIEKVKKVVKKEREEKKKLEE